MLLYNIFFITKTFFYIDIFFSRSFPCPPTESTFPCQPTDLPNLHEGSINGDDLRKRKREKSEKRELKSNKKEVYDDTNSSVSGTFRRRLSEADSIETNTGENKIYMLEYIYLCNL